MVVMGLTTSDERKTRVWVCASVLALVERSSRLQPGGHVALTMFACLLVQGTFRTAKSASSGAERRKRGVGQTYMYYQYSRLGEYFFHTEGANCRIAT
jgi:hypothetical protein